MNVIRCGNSLSLAERAAQLSVDALSASLKEFGEAVWVLAGGTTSVQSYKAIVERYRGSLDWQKVYFALGDERHVTLKNTDSNANSIRAGLLSKLDGREDHILFPVYNRDLMLMARGYESLLMGLPKDEHGLPRLDLIWLGLGSDGHTLSLFPGRLPPDGHLVGTVENSPKPPLERITLTYSALAQVKRCLILASGEDKAGAVRGLVGNDETLPIAKAANIIETHGSQVDLIIDNAAGSLIK